MLRRLHSLDSGDSVIDDLAIALDALPAGYVSGGGNKTLPASGLRRVTPAWNVQSAYFARVAPGYNANGSWHNTPEGERSLVVFLGPGELEIETSQGWLHRFRAGDMLLAEDSTGEGHRSRRIGDEMATMLYLRLADDSFDSSIQ
jgi:hypothetical protein